MNRKIIGSLFALILLLSVSTGLFFSNFAVADPAKTSSSNLGLSGGSWPMYLYNPAHTSTPDNIAPQTYDLLWKTDVLKDQSAFNILIGSSPAIVDGVVYIGSDDGDIYAIDASSGAQLWNRDLGQFHTSSPAVVGGVVYVRVWEGYNYALNATNGDIIWQNSNTGLGGSSPAVVNGIYYVINGENLTASNATTGASIWNSTFGANADGSPVIMGNTVYVADSGYIAALDAQTGAVHWNRLLELGNTMNAPAVANGLVYVGCEGNFFYALDASTGATVWNYSTVFKDGSTPVVANNMVYLNTYSGIIALNAQTGALIWNFATGAWLSSSVAVAGGNLYFVGTDGVLYILNANTGAKLWSYTLSNEPTNSSPAIANGILYIRDNNGDLCAFGKATEPSVTIHPSVGLVGSTSTISGAGFNAGTTVAATFGGTEIALGNPTVDSLGHFTATFTVPNRAPANYPITVTDTLGCTALTNFTIVTAPTTFWPMFMHDLRHTGSPDGMVPTSNNTLWTYKLENGEITNQIASQAAVVESIVYTASGNGYVYAFDAYTGQCYWKSNLPGMGTLSSPSVVDGVVYIGSDYGIIAIDAYTGERIWQSSNTPGILSSPAVVGGLVFTGSFVSHGTDEHAILAFRASDGQQVWKYITGEYADSSPAVVGSTVYIGSDDGYFYALNAVDGSLVWKLDVRLNSNDDNSASPTVVNGVVYTSSYYGNVFAIDASTGSKIWNHTVGTLGSGFSSPIVSNGVLYINGKDFMYALNTSNGEEMWQTPLTSHGSPAIVCGTIYASATDGNIWAINASTGQKTIYYTINAGIRVQLTVARGVIYVGTTNGIMYAIGTPDLTNPQPTPEPTPTAFPIPTPTPTASPTANPTPTPTSSSTGGSTTSTSPNPTQAPTFNPTASAAPTQTPNATQNPTETPTGTPSQETSPTTMPLLIGGGIGATAVCATGIGLVYYNKHKLNIAKQAQNQQE